MDRQLGWPVGSNPAWSGFFLSMLIVLPYLFRSLVCFQIPLAMGKHLVFFVNALQYLTGKVDNNN